MPSPFPGMNPYLEQSDTWEDFHQSFMTHARDVLSGKVGAHYLVKIEVRLYLHELPASERRYFGRADAGISTPAPGSRFGEVPGPVAAPVQLTLPAVDIERHASRDSRQAESPPQIGDRTAEPHEQAPGTGSGRVFGKAGADPGDEYASGRD